MIDNLFLIDFYFLAFILPNPFWSKFLDIVEERTSISLDIFLNWLIISNDSFRTDFSTFDESSDAKFIRVVCPLHKIFLKAYFMLLDS